MKKAIPFNLLEINQLHTEPKIPTKLITVVENDKMSQLLVEINEKFNQFLLTLFDFLSQWVEPSISKPHAIHFRSLTRSLDCSLVAGELLLRLNEQFPPPPSTYSYLSKHREL